MGSPSTLHRSFATSGPCAALRRSRSPRCPDPSSSTTRPSHSDSVSHVQAVTAITGYSCWARFVSCPRPTFRAAASPSRSLLDAVVGALVAYAGKLRRCWCALDEGSVCVCQVDLAASDLHAPVLEPNCEERKRSNLRAQSASTSLHSPHRLASFCVPIGPAPRAAPRVRDFTPPPFTRCGAVRPGEYTTLAESYAIA